MGTESFGLRICDRSLSAVYPELESLICTIYFKHERYEDITSIQFEADCLDLVGMTANPMN